MEDWWWAVVVVLVAVAVAAAASVARARRAERDRRRDRLRATFGAEYDEEVARIGRRAAETALEERARHLGSFDPPAVEPLLRAELAERWARLQLSFVDDPAEAVRRADRLVAQLLADRGHAVDSAADRSAAVVAEVPDLAAAYEVARGPLDEPPAADDPRAPAEWRHGLLALRDVFEALLDAPVAPEVDESLEGPPTAGVERA
jgi:hypothetical protein